LVESISSIVLEILERSVKLSAESVVTKAINSHCGGTYPENSYAENDRPKTEISIP
jgi:hypothetical protein